MNKTLACLLFLAPAGVAFAQAPAKPIATRDEYRACLVSSDEAAARVAALKKRKADHEAETLRLQDDMQAHLNAGAKIKQKDTDLLEAYNMKGEVLNARRDKLNANADQFAKDVAEHNRLGSEASARCSNLQVTREDREAVALERAGKK